MKTGTKIVIGITIFLFFLGVYGYRKAIKLKNLFDKIEIMPSGLRNLKVSSSRVSFEISVTLTNPTTDNFELNGYLVKLERLNFFYKGKYLATAKPALSSITILAQNQLEIKNVPVVLPTATVVANTLEFLNFDMANLTVEAVLDVAGSEYYIKQ